MPLKIFVGLVCCAYLCAAPTAEGQFSVCNKTSVRILSAITYWSAESQPNAGNLDNLLDDDDFEGPPSSGDWYTRGWFAIGPGECVTLLRHIEDPYIYVRGEEDKGSRVWGGNQSECVNSNAFTRATSRTCNGQNEEVRTFNQVYTGNSSIFDYNLTCTDCSGPPPRNIMGPAEFGEFLKTQATPTPVGRPQWQEEIDWCKRNGDAGGSVDCPLLYAYPECIVSGGRSCLMRKASQSARDGDCANAFRQALTCQCHNQGARDLIAQAGQDAVCRYLGPPPAPSPAPNNSSQPGVSRPVTPGSPHPVTFVNQSGITLYVYYFIRAGGRVDCKDYSFAGSMSPVKRVISFFRRHKILVR
jgi:uncharacterized membrane protein